MPELPEVGEVVVCKIAKVLDYGLFAELQEYEGLQGFVHISQVSSSWIKNIRNFVKEGQVRAAKVVHIDREKGQIDLSLNKVVPRLQRTRINEWKQMKRAQKLIEILAAQKEVDADAAWKEIAEPLLEHYDSLYEAFQQILARGESAAEGVEKKWLKPLVELVEKNIEAPKRTIKGVLTLTSSEPNGVELIKKALLGARDSAKDTEVEILYAGSGRYMVKVSSFDYKGAERAMKSVSENAVSSIKSSHGEGSFVREE